MKDRTLRRLHAIITRCIVYPQILNPIYLKYSQLISKNQVLRKKINKLNKIWVGHCMTSHVSITQNTVIPPNTYPTYI